MRNLIWANKMSISVDVRLARNLAGPVEPKPDPNWPVAVACMVSAVWPQERSAIEDFEEVLRPHCDWFGTFVALEPSSGMKRNPDFASSGESATSADERESLPKEKIRDTGTSLPLSSWSVVDLVAAYPTDMEPNRWSDPPNNIRKFHMMVRYMSDHAPHLPRGSGLSNSEAHHWWFCPLETDTFFLPENFRRLVALHRLNASAPVWLGGPRMHSAASDGILLEPMLSCFSHGALVRLGRLIEGLAAASVDDRMASVGMWQWPRVGAHSCSLGPWTGAGGPPWSNESTGGSAPSKDFRMDHEYMEVVNACFRAVGIYPLDPRLIHDARGRSYFTNMPLDAVAKVVAEPPPAPHYFQGKLTHDWFLDDRGQRISLVVWSGREYIYTPCQRAGQQEWRSSYPVMFHPHVRAELGLRRRGSSSLTKTFLSPTALDQIFRHGAPCPLSICGHYAAHVYNATQPASKLSALSGRTPMLPEHRTAIESYTELEQQPEAMRLQQLQEALGLEQGPLEVEPRSDTEAIEGTLGVLYGWLLEKALGLRT